MLKASGTTVHGQSGGPIYNESGLHAVLTRGEPDIRPTTIEGPCAAYIRQWLRDCCQVVIDADDHYRIETGDPPPIVDPGDTEEPEEDGELTALLTELTVNVNQLTVNVNKITGNLDDLTSRVTALEITVASIESTPGPQGPKGDKGDPGKSPTAAEVAALVKVEPIDPATLPPIYFRHIDGETGEVFKPEEPVHLGGGYEFVRHKIDWAEAAKKIAPHLPKSEGK
jgi:hypothetical protein